MKNRIGFVSNSSTASFIISRFSKDSLLEKAQRALIKNKREIKLLTIKEVLLYMYNKTEVIDDRLEEIRNLSDDIKCVYFFNYEDCFIVELDDIILIEACSNIDWNFDSEYKVIDEFPKKYINLLDFDNSNEYSYEYPFYFNRDKLKEIGIYEINPPYQKT